MKKHDYVKMFDDDESSCGSDACSDASLHAYLSVTCTLPRRQRPKIYKKVESNITPVTLIAG